MLRAIVLAVVIGLVATPAFAGYKKVVNKTYVTNVNEQTERWDYGVAGDVVLAETKNTEWGVRATHLVESEETRGYAYGKVYLNRLTWQKK